MDALHDSISEGLGDALQIAGQRKVPIVTCTIEDVLQPEDISEYISAEGSLPAQKAAEKDLQSLRARHHSVARLLAAGLPEGVVAELTGFTASHLSVLKNNPSMIELIALYRAPGNHAAELIAEKLRTLGSAAIDRLMDEMPDLGHNELIQVAKLGADRSGNGPQSKVDVAHTHMLEEGLVQKLAQDARRRNESKIIDISAVRKQLPSGEQK